MRLPLLLCLLLLAGCLPAQRPAAPAVTEPLLPEAPREFRGAWIATVANIDWPSRPGLSTADQQAELRRLLDRAATLHLNAVLLQVRPAADALYDSPYEPWSDYLTGTMGEAPAPYYDPLAFAVEEAHRRGLELHAWFNPFRARHPSARGRVAAGHVSRTHPEWVRRYGPYLWLDPGEPGARAHVLQVILDVVRRYDIDGVHFDDYFYPYPEQNAAGAAVPFPDSLSWARARHAGVTLSRDDWRRQNIDQFIEQLYHAIRQAKPHVRFGISPFGIWRPGSPPSVQGFDAYARLYADARKWLRAGWMDYVTPQLYWAIDQEGQRFPELLAWWAEQNTRGRHLWPGLFTSRVGSGDARHWPAGEILSQIRLMRAHPGASGHVHFSMRALMNNPESLPDLLRAGPYEAPALVPAAPWLDADPPGRPHVRMDAVGDQRVLMMQPAAGTTAWRWVVRLQYGEQWIVDIVPGWQQTYPLPRAAPPDGMAVSAVDRAGNEGPAYVVGHPAAAQPW